MFLSPNSDGKDTLVARINSVSPEEEDLVPVIFATESKPTDVLGGDSLLADAFSRLGGPSADPATNLHVLTDGHNTLNEAFCTQPYS